MPDAKGNETVAEFLARTKQAAVSKVAEGVSFHDGLVKAEIVKVIEGDSSAAARKTYKPTILLEIRRPEFGQSIFIYVSAEMVEKLSRDPLIVGRTYSFEIQRLSPMRYSLNVFRKYFKDGTLPVIASGLASVPVPEGTPGLTAEPR